MPERPRAECVALAPQRQSYSAGLGFCLFFFFLLLVFSLSSVSYSSLAFLPPRVH